MTAKRPAYYEQIREQFKDYVLLFHYVHDGEFAAFDDDARTVAAILTPTREPNPELDVFAFDRDEARKVNDAVNARDGVCKIISVY